MKFKIAITISKAKHKATAKINRRDPFSKIISTKDRTNKARAKVKDLDRDKDLVMAINKRLLFNSSHQSPKGFNNPTIINNYVKACSKVSHVRW